MPSIELIKTYIRLQKLAGQFMTGPWHNPELEKVVKEEISELKIEELLNEVIDTGSIKCKGCGKTMRPEVDMCLSCKWENPLVHLNIISRGL